MGTRLRKTVSLRSIAKAVGKDPALTQTDSDKDIQKKTGIKEKGNEEEEEGEILKGE